MKVKANYRFETSKDMYGIKSSVPSLPKAALPKFCSFFSSGFPVLLEEVFEPPVMREGIDLSQIRENFMLFHLADILVK